MRLFGKLTGNKDKPVETYQCFLHINTHCCVSKNDKLFETQLHVSQVSRGVQGRVTLTAALTKKRTINLIYRSFLLSVA